MPLDSPRMLRVELMRPSFGYEDVEAGGAGGLDGDRGKIALGIGEAAVEGAGEFAVEVDLRVVVELVEDEIAVSVRRGAGCGRGCSRRTGRSCSMG